VTNDPDLTTAKPTVRLLDPGDLPEVAELLKAAFEQPWPNFPIAVSPLEHLTWKTSSPTQIPEALSVMEIDGRIVSYAGSMTRDVWMRGRQLQGWSGADRAIHPDFQERGLVGIHREWVSNRWEPGQEPMSVAEGSTHPRLLRSQVRRGERVLVANKVDMLILPLTIDAAGSERDGRLGWKSTLRRVRVRVAMFAARLRRRPRSTSTRPLSLETADSFDERADRLWERTRDAFEFSVVRDSTYLNWRYGDPRAGIYRVRIAVDGDELAGFVITTTINSQTRIVDLLATPGDDEALRALIKDALDHAQSEGANSLAVLMPRVHPYRQTYVGHGFIHWSQMEGVGFNNRNLWALDFLAKDSNAGLHIAFGDSDHM